jgi:hypothetical protein
MTTPKALLGRIPLFKTMAGSRLYGTQTPASDIDWKEIFLPEIDQLLIGRKPVNVVITTGGDHARNTKDDIDNEYIPIQVFANDFIGGQTYAIELAFAAISTEFKASQEVYSMEFLEFVHDLTEKFLTSNIKAMLGYAMNQAQIYGIKGTRLATVRKFTDKLHQIIEMNPLAREYKLELLTQWVEKHTDKYMFMSTYENMDVQRPAISLLEKLYPCTITIGEAYDRTLMLKDKYGSRAESAEAANGVDWKAISHAVRISLQAVDILENHRLDFPLSESRIELLLAIKNGEKEFRDVEAILTMILEDLDRIKDITTLPAKSHEMEAEFEMWLKDWMKRFYLEN